MLRWYRTLLCDGKTTLLSFYNTSRNRAWAMNVTQRHQAMASRALGPY